MAAPTQYADLNGVLRRLVDGARAALEENFVGAYLQGSFALGDADEHSDVDFVVVTDSDVGDEEEARLQELHATLYALDVPWAQHLEGSYVHRALVRHVDPQRTPLLYLDNGADELVRDAHCNTAVVRWALREHGIVLAGPEPTALVAPVSSGQLRAEARGSVVEYAAWASEPPTAGGMSRWKQPYLVITFCRLLYTIECGRVASKRAAATWALDALDPQWRDLIQAAIDDRPRPWARVRQPADPALVLRTLAFADYAASQSKEC